MKKVKIWFSGMENEKEVRSHVLCKMISSCFEVEVTEDCDFLFVSYKDYIYDREYLKKDCVRIFFSTENIFPDYNVFDYAMCPNYLPVGDRFLWLPFYWWEPESWNLLQSTRYDDWIDREDFCCFIVSNTNAEPTLSNPKISMRELAFDELSKYKKVDSPGRFRNNCAPIEVDPSSGKTFYSAKLDYMRRYRFAIVFENSRAPGNTTEKIIHAFLAGCIPIYWGDPKISEQFKESTFINVNTENSLPEVLELVKEIDLSKDAYQQYFRDHPVYKEKFKEICSKDYVKTFLKGVLDQDVIMAKRRSRYYLNDQYERHLRGGVSDETDDDLCPIEKELVPDNFLPHSPHVDVRYKGEMYMVRITDDWKGYIEYFGGRFKNPPAPKFVEDARIPEGSLRMIYKVKFKSVIPVIVSPYLIQYNDLNDIKTDFRDSPPMTQGEMEVESTILKQAKSYKIAIRFTREDRKNESFQVDLSKMSFIFKIKKK